MAPLPARSPLRALDPPATRDAVNAVFEAASTLLEAASELRGAAEQPNAAGAAPAVLGCIEEIQQQLAAAVGALGQDADAMLATGRACTAPPSAERRERMRRGFANLEIALGDAAAAAAASRSLTARALHGAQGRSV